MITGYEFDSGKYSSSYNKFKFQSVSDKNVRRALEIVHLSDQIKIIQSKYTGTYLLILFSRLVSVVYCNIMLMCCLQN